MASQRIKYLRIDLTSEVKTIKHFKKKLGPK